MMGILFLIGIVALVATLMFVVAIIDRWLVNKGWRNDPPEGDGGMCGGEL